MPTTADAAMYTIGCSFFVGLTTFVSTQMTAASSSPFPVSYTHLTLPTKA